MKVNENRNPYLPTPEVRMPLSGSYKTGNGRFWSLFTDAYSQTCDIIAFRVVVSEVLEAANIIQSRISLVAFKIETVKNLPEREIEDELELSRGIPYFHRAVPSPISLVMIRTITGTYMSAACRKKSANCKP